MIQSHPFGQVNSTDWYANNFFAGNVSVLEAWSRSQLALNATAGEGEPIRRALNRAMVFLASWDSLKPSNGKNGSSSFSISLPIYLNRHLDLEVEQASAFRA